MDFFAPIYNFLHSWVGVALLFALLLLGLWNMLRQPPGNTSQRLMRWRVGIQFAVICVLLGLLLLRR
jgi:hypothetical protein